MPKRELTSQEIQDVLQKLEQYLTDLKARWDRENPGNRSWWKITKTYLVTSTTFIISILDELINFVEELIPTGTDKKAAVMIIVAKLFDYIVVQAFPIWLKPFAPIIKDIVVTVIVGTLIDYIVAKYNAGFWKPEGTENGAETQKA